MHIITRTAHPRQTPAWRRELACAVREPRELLARLGLDPGLLAAAQAATRAFPLRVPLPYLARIRRGDPDDPLLRQVLPLGEELRPVPGYTADPLHESAARSAPGLLRKYRGRALLVTTGACAVHCRYCFRRHYPYAADATARPWDAALERLRADPSLREVILSGGDPLSLRDESLARLAAALDAIPHLTRLRIHTRLPVMIPQRVTEELCDWLTGGRLRPVVVIHANHARELDGAVCGALLRLGARGITLLNQSVLLRGVNDRVADLVDLSETLFGAGVLPYYLHALDPVQGAAHFAVPDDAARRLHETLSARLPGYLVPRLVREVPGASAKLPLA